MGPITVSDLLEATGGALIGPVPSILPPVTRLCYDTRTLSPGDVFLPLIGERVDGHSLMEKALADGAVGTFTMRDRDSYTPGKFYIRVRDTAQVPRALAAWYKRRVTPSYIAVTGSVGKTTTKDMVAAVLSEKFHVHKTQENHNNLLGVSMALLDLEAGHRFSVIEMGMNHPGEIDDIAALVQPQAALITNIGDAHIENLGSREGILAAKCEVFTHMAPDAPAILNGDDPMLRALKGKLGRPVLLCGTAPDCDYRVTGLDRDLVTEDLSCTLHTPQGDIPIVIPGLAVGDYMIYPVAMAAAAGQYFGMTGEEIARGVLRYAPTKMRMNVIDRGSNVRILDDSYNANPQSMRAGLQTLAASKREYKMAILGDMMELGSMAPSLHALVGKMAGECDIQCLVAIGALSKDLAAAAGDAQVPEVYWFATKEEALPAIAKLVRPNSAILVKASRRMEFEEITSYLVSIIPEA